MASIAVGRNGTGKGGAAHAAQHGQARRAEERGRSRLHELIRSPSSAGSSREAKPMVDYAATYGRTLGELEAARLDSLGALDR